MLARVTFQKLDHSFWKKNGNGKRGADHLVIPLVKGRGADHLVIPLVKGRGADHLFIPLVKGRGTGMPITTSI